MSNDEMIEASLRALGEKRMQETWDAISRLVYDHKRSATEAWSRVDALRADNAAKQNALDGWKARALDAERLLDTYRVKEAANASTAANAAPAVVTPAPEEMKPDASAAGPLADVGALSGQAPQASAAPPPAPPTPSSNAPKGAPFDEQLPPVTRHNDQESP